MRRRLLINALVDPDEAASRLPPGLRPHVTELGTVVGCCLLELAHVRPARLPAAAGITIRAAAHRISAEWDDGSAEPVVGVHVPARRTDARLAVALGGRWFPGVHGPARVGILATADNLAWRVDDDHGFGIRVTASTAPNPTAMASEPVGDTCVSAAIGLSPDRHGRLEAVRMEPDHRSARTVKLEDLHSTFLAKFATARPAPAYLMEDIGVTWTPARAARAERAAV